MSNSYLWDKFVGFMVLESGTDGSSTMLERGAKWNCKWGGGGGGRDACGEERGGEGRV